MSCWSRGRHYWQPENSVGSRKEKSVYFFSPSPSVTAYTANCGTQWSYA